MSDTSAKEDGTTWGFVALVIAAMIAAYVVGRIDQNRHDRRAAERFSQRIFVSAMVCGSFDPDAFACKELKELSAVSPLARR